MFDRRLLILGYDNFKQSYISANVNSIDTAMTHAEGDMTQSGDALLHCLEPRDKPEVLRARMTEAAMRAFRITWAREKRRDHVYVLTALPRRVLGFAAYAGGESGSSYSSHAGTEVLFRGTLGDLAETLGRHLQLTVLDETWISGSWEGTIEWRRGPDGLIDALREKGLGLALEVREVDVIVIRRQ